MDPTLPKLDLDWMQEVMVDLLRIPSPTGRTDECVQYVGEVLDDLGVDFELTRRGALLAKLPGESTAGHRAVVAHVDTIGAMVSEVTDRGRLSLDPLGHHSARFSEGARVTIFTDDVDVTHTGTILPLKASGHAYDDEVDTQAVGWDNLEVRVDAPVASAADVADLGIRIGDFVSAHALPQITRTGYVNARHLDDKAGVAAALTAFKALVDQGIRLPVSAHLLVTITEEVGHGAAHGLHEDVAEMLSVDTAVVAPGQQSSEHAVTVAMKDMTGPFDYHLTRRLLRLADEHDIAHRRDVFRYYRSDIAAALEAGAETRAALIGFGCDATHGYERTHLDALRATAELIALFVQTELTFHDWDAEPLGPLAEFPSSSVQPAEREPGIEPPPDE